jgi:hypothetical protein
MVRSASNETMMRESPVKEKKKTRTLTVDETGHGVGVTRCVPGSGGGANVERLATRYVTSRGGGANLERLPTRYVSSRGGGANLESLPTRYVWTGVNTVVTSYNNVDWLECLLTPMLIPLPSDFLVET